MSFWLSVRFGPLNSTDHPHGAISIQYFAFARASGLFKISKARDNLHSNVEAANGADVFLKNALYVTIHSVVTMNSEWCVFRDRD